MAGPTRRLQVGGASDARRRVPTPLPTPRHAPARLRPALLLAALVAVPALAGAQTYDAAADFSAAANPNGVWRYGFKTTPLGALTAYTLSGTTNGIQFWTSNTTGDNTPGVYRFQDGGAVFHPGSVGEISVFRFVAPTAGTYAITSRYFGRNPSATTDVAVVQNGVSLFSAMINGSTELKTYNNAGLSLAAGDVVDFQVGTGNGSHISDATGLEARLAVLSPTAVVPEPSTYALLGTGLAGLVGVARRRRALT